ncbi:MAG: YciK family oxidoreductase [Gammaproteobacteria bacterium]|nr:MAG: YciK family oxidoreductase [Gammaproteobacteria bacterium]
MCPSHARRNPLIPHAYHPPPDLLKDRNILVTGCDQDLGAAIAKTMAFHGATVILVGHPLQSLEALYDAIEEAGAPKPAIYPLDMSQAAPESFAPMTDILDRAFGRLDGLVHGAALLGRLSPIEHYDPRIWQKVVQFNLHAPFLLTRACLPLLKRSQDASMVFTSDEVGRKGKAFWGAYAVSLFGVEGLMQVLADELENTAVRVNSLAPGRLRTSLRAQAYPGADPHTWLPIETALPAYLYLLGPDSRGVHGQALTL